MADDDPTWREQTRAMIAANSQSIEDLARRVGDLGNALVEAERASVARDADLTERIGALRTEVVELVSSLRTDMTDGLLALSKAVAAVDARVTGYHGPPEGDPGDWRDTDDLIAPGKTVLGYHCGGGSDVRTIAGEMGHPQQVDTIYWQSLKSPADACARMITNGTIPRLELELIRALCNAGAKAQDENGSIWHRMAEGQYDETIVGLLQSVASLGRPIILSWGHESDYSSEQGAHPKGSDRPEDQCGTPAEFREAWIHVAALARVHAPNARLFLNLGGGYKDAGAPGGKWDKMWPGEEHVDFFGYDFYNPYGVGDPPSEQWDSFETRLKMYGRWDWYLRNCPNTPLIVGEFGTCEGPGGDKHGGKWILDGLDFMGAHPYVPGQGGFAHAIYFSYRYTHTRQLDDGGQKQSVLPAIGAHPALAWSTS